jgi:hypothetical protein
MFRRDGQVQAAERGRIGRGPHDGAPARVAIELVVTERAVSEYVNRVFSKPPPTAAADRRRRPPPPTAGVASRLHPGERVRHG